MSFNLSSEFPPQENFYHIAEVATKKHPFIPSREFMSTFKNMSEANEADQEVALSKYPTLEKILGQDFSREIDFEDLLEFDGEGRSFREFGWHVDLFDSEFITLFSSSTPALLAACNLEIVDKFLAEDFEDYAEKGPYDLFSFTYSILQNFNTRFGKHWLEVAGGLMDGKDRKRIEQTVKVSDLAIAQVMPCVAVTAPTKTTLHSSAYWYKRPWYHRQQRQRVFAKSVPQSAKD